MNANNIFYVHIKVETPVDVIEVDRSIVVSGNLPDSAILPVVTEMLNDVYKKHNSGCRNARAIIDYGDLVIRKAPERVEAVLEKGIAVGHQRNIRLVDFSKHYPNSANLMSLKCEIKIANTYVTNVDTQ